MTAGGGARIELQPRRDLRERARRRQRLRRLGLVLLVAVVAGAVVWAVFFSGLTATNQVEIRGNELVSSEEITQTARVPMGTPLARVDIDAIQQRLLAVPAVAEVRVSRRLMHTILIEVVERQMVYQLLNDNGYQWVDQGGHLFETRADPVDGVVVVAKRPTQEVLAGVAGVVGALPESVSTQTQGIEVSRTGFVVITLTDGRVIKWGETTATQEKADLLPHLMQVPGTVYDISVPSHPAVS